MLTADLVRPRLRLRGAELSIDFIAEQDPSWCRVAADLITLLRRQVGCAQADWDHTVETYAGDRVDYPVVRGLAKTLTDAATFIPPATPLAPAQLRERLFEQGPVFSTRQLFDTRTRYEVVQSTAAELGVSMEQMEDTIFADRPAAYILTDAGPAWSPADLLARYNLELARGALYWASQIQIEAHGSYKDLWKYLKLFKLMFWAQLAQPDGYRIDLDGPISPFVHATTRYGRQFAAFLPALLLCERWRLVATVHPPQFSTTATYRLDYTTPLRTHFARSGPFDSRLEADFAQEFAEKFGGKRGQWLLTREDEALLLDDTVMIPDFALTHKKTGHRVLLELVGFWHPHYLRRKVEKVRAAQCRHLLLLVYERVNLAPERLHDTPGEVLYFKNKPVIKDVMAAVERIAERVYGLPPAHHARADPTAPADC
jgi:predicted nuclease of restriction endonuclease-like RecB superfamily